MDKTFTDNQSEHGRDRQEDWFHRFQIGRIRKQKTDRFVLI